MKEVSLRLAEIDDLEELQQMYQAIVINMEQQNLQIWDDVYPCICLESDIRKRTLYVLTTASEIIGACTLSDHHIGEDQILWQMPKVAAFYLDRLGIKVQYAKQGIGSRLLQELQEVVKAQNGEWLRLFVVKENVPAVRFYEKNGFIKADGSFLERIDEEVYLQEFGYEYQIQ